MVMEARRVEYRHAGKDAAYLRAMEETRREFGFPSWKAARQWLWRCLNKSAPPELRDMLPASADLVWVPDVEGGYVVQRRALDIVARIEDHLSRERTRPPE
jgi:hypothetical protein